MTDYFSDREHGPRPRNEEVVSPKIWAGIVTLVQSLITTGAFGAKYPKPCPEGHGPIGTDEKALAVAIRIEVPGLELPLATTTRIYRGLWSEVRPYAPETLQVLDFLEFCYRAVAKPIQDSRHDSLDHYHLSFDEAEGKQTFVSDINRILSRNNLAYELSPAGQVMRLAPSVLNESLSSARFDTGDPALDALLEDACIRFLNPDPSIRRQSVELLWRCWEQLQSLENPGDKKHPIESMPAKTAAGTAFRSVLEVEARTLTEIGNSFHIGHSQTMPSGISDPAHLDYLFHRLYSMLQLILPKRGSVP